MRLPKMLIVAGFAGSGKTEVARRLAAELGWPVLDKDTLTRPVTSRLLELYGETPHDRETETYRHHVRPVEYEILEDTAYDNLRCGVSVILSAPYIWEVRDPEWRQQAQLKAAAVNAELRIIWVRCDADTMRRQLIERGARRDDYKLAHWETYLQIICPEVEATEPFILIDNSCPRSAPLDELVEHAAVELVP